MLTATQIAAIIMLLQSFGVSQPVIAEVRADLVNPPSTLAPQANNVPLPVLYGIPPVFPYVPTTNVVPIMDCWGPKECPAHGG